jgi:hypothetical protein
MSSGIRVLLAAALAILFLPVLVVMVVVAVVSSEEDNLGGAQCGTGAAGGELTASQAGYAGVIAEVGAALGVTDAGVVIAIATSLVEAELRNYANSTVPASLDYAHDAVGSDHDSVGLFQQRPSQGWGTVAELMDPATSAAAFYGALLEVPGWESLEPGVAAQAVQRSAFPDRYTTRLAQAGAIVAAVTGGENPCTAAGQLVEVPTATGSTTTVDASIASQVAALYEAAAADGIALAGSGWRSNQRQIELRTINGCPDVYTSSPSSCAVPTAIPGRSLHERGLAVDFTCDGVTVRRGTACDRWLLANAPTFGLLNLPSESWHYSTSGG